MIAAGVSVFALLTAQPLRADTQPTRSRVPVSCDQSNCCWIDVKTGQAVASGPILHEPRATLTGYDIGTYGILPEPSDPDRAFDPKSGRNFARDPKTCRWVDVKTGATVASGPILREPRATLTGYDIGTYGILPELSDPDRAFDPKSGRNFARVPCPEKTAAAPTPQPAGGCKTASALTPLTPLGGAVIDQLNFARTQPGEFAKTLAIYRDHFHGNLVKEPGQPLAATNEGTAAVDEAIAFLGKQKPLPPLAPNPLLTDAASRFAAEAGPAGVMGHTGATGSTLADRLKADCFAASYIGEVIAYHQASAAAVVRSLIIDDGLKSRSHRSDIFSPVAQSAGVGCGPHASQGTLCVIDLASANLERPATATMSLADYHARLDALHATHRPPFPCDTIKDSIDLDAGERPTGATINYFCRDFDLPLYIVSVTGGGDPGGEGPTPAYRAYSAMKAAVDGGFIYGAFSYDYGPYGRYVQHAVVKDKDGHTRGIFDFNPDGTVKTGQVFNGNGVRTGVVGGS